MAARVYVEKPVQVNAEQFFTATTPWPPQVISTPEGPMVQWPSGMQTPIHDSEWITVNVRTQAQQVLTNAEFQARYGSGGGPPEA